MGYLKANGYRVISMSELFAFLNYRSALPEKSVVLTIDDGYRATYEIAYPILKKYGFAGTLFVYTDFIGASGAALSWDQLKDMKANGFEVGSHTLSHCDLTKKREGEDMERYGARVRRELLLSKEIIDKNLDQDTIALAFPYGEYNQRILYLCEKIGYRIGVSVKSGGNPFFSDPLTLRRDQMLKKDMGSFVSKLKTFHKLPLQ
jgi:peptidoglycan/xylan/chitin deacetylase (PgdA/CDA1 family)